MQAANEYGAARQQRRLGTKDAGRNGNLAGRPSGSVQWTSFNLPASIIDTSGEEASFSYAPSRARYKQTATVDGTVETTRYAGGLLVMARRKMAEPALYR